MPENSEKAFRPWANPAALGFVALAVGVFAMAPILCRWVSPAALPLTAPWSTISLVTLVIATIILFRNRNILVGTTFGVLGVLLGGGLALQAFQLTSFVTNNVGLSTEIVAAGTTIDSMVLMVIAVILIPTGYLAGRMSTPLAIVTWLASTGLWLKAAAGFIGPDAITADIVGGYLILVQGIWFLYMGVALLVNGTLDKTAVPIGPPLFRKPESTSGE